MPTSFKVTTLHFVIYRFETIAKQNLVLTWPNGLNSCLRSFSVASKATFFTSNLVELLSFSTFFSTCSSFLAWQSCKISAWPSKTVPLKMIKILRVRISFPNCYSTVLVILARVWVLPVSPSAPLWQSP